MGARELGNPLGNPLARARQSMSFNEVLESCSFDVSVPLDSSQNFDVPFQVSSPSELDIEWTNSAGSGGAGMGVNRATLIPTPSGGGSLSFYTNGATGSSVAISYSMALNRVTVTASVAAHSGSIRILRRNRRVKNFSSPGAVSSSGASIGFRISNPSRTWLGTNGGANNTPGFVNTYISALDSNSWHMSGYATNKQIKITDAENLLGGSSTSYSVNVIEFE